MDIIDNVMYAKIFRGLDGSGGPILSDYVQDILAGTAPVPSTAGAYNYTTDQKFQFCAYEDPKVIEQSVLRHWYDLSRVPSTPVIYNQGSDVFSDFTNSTTYHLIYAYLLENTRMVQIFERLIEKYFQDEDLGIAEDAQTYRWIENSERLFFKSDSLKGSNIRSLIRPSYDASRRNAYFRMFGMDLAFGDLSAPSNGATYYKAKASNQQFVPLFERYLAEIWQGYQNARNTSGPNTTDINNIIDMALQLREMLQARRGGQNNFGERNLSREEFSSVLLMSWFTFAISFNSELVDFLACESSTIGERLLKIGDRVGIPAHRKSQALFELAGPTATVLSAIEEGTILENIAWVNGMLSTADPTANPSPAQRNFMEDFLTIINNWEKATGHKIKNPEASITGTVKVQSAPATNGRPQPVMN